MELLHFISSVNGCICIRKKNERGLRLPCVRKEQWNYGTFGLVKLHFFGFLLRMCVVKFVESDGGESERSRHVYICLDLASGSPIPSY